MYSNQKQWKERPAPKLSIYRLSVTTLEASTKFEGRWICQGKLNDQTEVKFWMSHKQAGSLHRNLDAPTIFAVIDEGDPEKLRFVWASNDLEWLKNSFLKGTKAEQPTQFEAPKKDFKKPYKAPEPNRFETEEELPF